MARTLLDINPWQHNLKVLSLIETNVLTPSEGWRLFVHPECCTVRNRAYPYRVPPGGERWHYDVFPPIEKPDRELPSPRWGPFRNDDGERLELQ